MFDLNDFDETLPGPFEYDVKRMAASFMIAARNNGAAPSGRRRSDRGTPTRPATSGRRARVHRRIGLGSVGGDGASDRDQCGEAHELQRLRLELQGLGVDRLHGASSEPRVVEAERA
jgi:Uncharacterized protein conserved in bacteria (DUF2252)